MSSSGNFLMKQGFRARNCLADSCGERLSPGLTRLGLLSHVFVQATSTHLAPSPTVSTLPDRAKRRCDMSSRWRRTARCLLP